MRVLVVDDYPGAADMACVLVRTLGHEASAACCGAQAVEETFAFQPDVIVVDLELPDFDGYEVVRRVRADAGKRPFIALMTGWDHPDSRVRALAAGVDMYVLKPASAENLAKIIDAAQRWFNARDEEHRA